MQANSSSTADHSLGRPALGLPIRSSTPLHPGSALQPGFPQNVPPLGPTLGSHCLMPLAALPHRAAQLGHPHLQQQQLQQQQQQLQQLGSLVTPLLSAAGGDSKDLLGPMLDGLLSAGYPSHSMHPPAGGSTHSLAPSAVQPQRGSAPQQMLPSLGGLSSLSGLQSRPMTSQQLGQLGAPSWQRLSLAHAGPSAKPSPLGDGLHWSSGPPREVAGSPPLASSDPNNSLTPSELVGLAELVNEGEMAHPTLIRLHARASLHSSNPGQPWWAYASHVDPFVSIMVPHRQ